MAKLTILDVAMVLAMLLHHISKLRTILSYIFKISGSNTDLSFVNKTIKGTLMQIWKSLYMFVFI